MPANIMIIQWNNEGEIWYVGHLHHFTTATLRHAHDTVKLPPTIVRRRLYIFKDARCTDLSIA